MFAKATFTTHRAAFPDGANTHSSGEARGPALPCSRGKFGSRKPDA